MYEQIKFNDDFILSTYTLSIVVGLVLMFLLFMYRAKKYNYSERDVSFAVQMLVISMGVGFITSIIFDALFKIPENHEFKLSGITFYGGLIGGVGTFAILMSFFKKKTNIQPIQWINVLVPGILIGHFFGRIGCFLGGCCYGIETNSFIGVVFPTHTESSIHAKVYPTQLFEAFAILVILVFVLKFIKKNHFYFYLISYGIARFFIEFLRGDHRGTLFEPLSPAQFTSIILIMFSLTMLFIQHFNNIILKEAKE